MEKNSIAGVSIKMLKLKTQNYTSSLRPMEVTCIRKMTLSSTSSEIFTMIKTKQSAKLSKEFRLITASSIDKKCTLTCSAKPMKELQPFL